MPVYGDLDWVVGEITEFCKDFDCFKENGLPDWEKFEILYISAGHSTTWLTIVVKLKQYVLTRGKKESGTIESRC